MALIMRREDTNGPSEIWNVTSGGLIVGRILQHNTGGNNLGTWGFSINFTVRPHTSAADLNAGGFATREAAMAEFRARWEAWLEWAGLREME